MKVSEHLKALCKWQFYFSLLFTVMSPNKCIAEVFGRGTSWNVLISYLMCRASGIFCCISVSSGSEWKEFARIFARGMNMLWNRLRSTHPSGLPYFLVHCVLHLKQHLTFKKALLLFVITYLAY